MKRYTIGVAALEKLDHLALIDAMMTRTIRGAEVSAKPSINKCQIRPFMSEWQRRTADAARLSDLAPSGPRARRLFKQCPDSDWATPRPEDVLHEDWDFDEECDVEQPSTRSVLCCETLPWIAGSAICYSFDSH
jgi:hypothetical protein